MSVPIDSMKQSRLKWQCRRGMRELDDLLTNYLERHYESADADEKQAFEALLELPDPLLMGYLLSRQQPDSERIGNVVKHILGRDTVV
jgi:antitoxin CptB